MPRKSRSALLTTVRRALAEVADPKRALAMQAYMKSRMPYHGVRMPMVRALCKDIFGATTFESARAWESEVRSMWRKAEYREERYAAIILSGIRAARDYQTPVALDLYDHMIVTGAWWDVVDEIATHRVGPIFRAHPREVRPVLLRWSKEDDMWRRRTAIISQARSGKGTDVKLLYACIEPSIGSTEFFLRKAIGWSLRELARFQPREVARYVRANESRLSGLSKREALKHVDSVH
jgi:3-methyladenine DNA glycosylase AlkD